MQMNMEDFLPRNSSVGEVQIHSVDGERSGTHRRGDLLRDGEDPGTVVGIERGQSTGMALRHDQEMAGCERPNIHEGKNVRIVVDDTGLGLTGDDGTEDAVHGLRPLCAFSVVVTTEKAHGA